MQIMNNPKPQTECTCECHKEVFPPPGEIKYCHKCQARHGVIEYDNKRYSEEKLNEPEDTLSTSNRPSIDPPEDSQSWEEEWEKTVNANYNKPEGGRHWLIREQQIRKDRIVFIKRLLSKHDLEQNKRINTEMERRVNEAYEQGGKDMDEKYRKLMKKGGNFTTTY